MSSRTTRAAVRGAVSSQGLASSVRSDPQWGPLLFRANQQYLEELHEAAAYRRLQRRLTQQERGSSSSWRLAGVAALVGGVAAALWLGSAPSSPSPTRRVVLSAEPSPRRENTSPSPARDEQGAAPLPALSPTASTVASPSETPSGAVSSAAELPSSASEPRKTVSSAAELPSSASEPRKTVSSAAEPVASRSAQPSPPTRASSVSPSEPALEPPQGPSSSEAPPSPPSSAPAAAGALPAPDQTKEDCLGLARAGSTAAAERCFRRQAEGSGLDAELALYELARLRRDVRGDVRGALVPLDEALRRYPRGTLSDEIRLLRLELLVESRQATAALAASEQLLASAVGKRRAAELYLLRGHVQRTLNQDYEAAAAEYTRAEAAGPLGARAAYYLGWCLERLARQEQAIEAYQRYLQADSSEHRQQARRALQRLDAKPPAPGTLRPGPAEDSL